MPPRRESGSSRCGTFGGGPLPGNLLKPWGIAVDKDGFVLVADSGYNRIQVFDRHGALVRILGAPGRSPGEFHRPTAIATDADGDVYVAEAGNHRIQVLTRTGAFVRMWGSEGERSRAIPPTCRHCRERRGSRLCRRHLQLPDPGVCQRWDVPAKLGHRRERPRASSTIRKPWHGTGPGPEGIAVIAPVVVYVADPWNHRVQVFASDGRYLREWRHLPGPCGQFSTPDAIARCKRSYPGRANRNRGRSERKRLRRQHGIVDEHGYPSMSRSSRQAGNLTGCGSRWVWPGPVRDARGRRG